MLGINLQLFNITTPQANLTDLQVCWWDEQNPKDMESPTVKASDVYTDGDGYLNLDLSNVSKLDIGEYGYLLIYKLDGVNHEDSLVFAGQVAVSDIVSGINVYEYSDIWVRPLDWPDLDPLVPGERKIQFLHPVFDIPDGTICSIDVRNDFTIDWGDGTVENLTGGGHSHTYDFSSAGLSAVTSEGYKCAVITITPQDGFVIDYVNIYSITDNYHNQSPKMFLEAVINMDTLTSISIANNYASNNPELLQNLVLGENSIDYLSGKLEYLDKLKRAYIDCSNSISVAELFDGCDSLIEVELANTGGITTFNSTFRDCASLRSVKIGDTSAATNMAEMFKSCKLLKRHPKLVTSSVTTMNSMFHGCEALLYISGLNTPLVTDFLNFAYNCASLVKPPILDMSSVTDISGLYSYCRRLESVYLDLKNRSVAMNNTFSYCSNLKEITIDNCGPITGLSSTFLNCYDLKNIPNLNISASSLSYTFSFCYSLKDVSNLDFSSITSASGAFRFTPIQIFPSKFPSLTTGSYLFRDMTCLSVIPALDFSQITTTSSMFYGVRGVKRIMATGMSVDWDISDQLLGPQALDEIFTNLATVASATITITGNYGAATCDTTIATNKGWTVVN